MKYSILLAAFMTAMNFTEYGMFWFSAWLLTLLIVCKLETLRNFMFGFYIVFGFWFFIAG